MPVFETFAKRMRKRRGDVPDVYTYDSVPEPLRVQIVHIMFEILGDPETYHFQYGDGPKVRRVYEAMSALLRKERGVFMLPPSTSRHTTCIEEISNNILDEPDVEELLSTIEVVCRSIEIYASEHDYRYVSDAHEVAKEAIWEINQRFQEHGVGYEYNGQLIRIDNELVHAEAVKPALQLLGGKNYSGAQQEFLSGYEHYRQKNYEEALNDALKSLESTLKAIFDKRQWQYDADRDTCSKLIQIALDHDLIPRFWQAHFTALRTTLEAGVPTGRNKLGGHGQGATPRSVPPHLAAYVLHMTASAIVFLVKSEEALS